MTRTRSNTRGARDGFAPAPGSGLHEEHEFLSALLDKHKESWTYQYLDRKDEPVILHVRRLEPEQQCRIVHAALERMEFAESQLRKALGDELDDLSIFDEDSWLFGAFFSQMIDVLLRKQLPVDEDLIAKLLNWGAQERPFGYPEVNRGTVTALEHFAKTHELPPGIVGAAERCRQSLLQKNEKQDRKIIDRLSAVTGSSPEVHVEPGEAWSDAARADLQSMKPKERRAWNALLAHCLAATAGSPQKKWLDDAKTFLRAVGEDDFKRRMLRWLPLVDKPRTAAVESWSEWSPNPNLLIIEPHADILKGLAWGCALFEDRDIARALAGLAISAYRKVPQIGPRLTRVGNAAVWALGAMPGRDAVGQLALLKIKVKFGTAQKGIEKALAAAADREGLPRDELEEMAVPAYGLENVGVRDERLGGYTARLTVTGTTSTELNWLRPDGKPQKSVPAAVRKGYAEELKELSAAAKDIQKMLPAQRDRIDGLFLQRKSWPLPVWRERYLDHPLVGTLARRLIWQFSTGRRAAAGIWLDDRLVGPDDRPLSGLGEKTAVELWHPIGRPVDQVLAWREWLQTHEVRQPFKQAHRELYLLTDAERRTRTYSNRYAAHILRQHQFNALCAARGWKNQLRLMVDADYPPAMRLLPEWGLRAEYWVEGAGDNYGTDTNETGTFLYLVTDQVRFYPLEAAQRSVHAAGGGYYTHGSEGSDTPLALEHVPPLVFSEVMRDVDLFVGVASVGNDPNWSDGGPEGRYRDYWQSYSFGDLSATAQTRRETLQRLVPRLKIAERCSFDERFLVVRGDLRSYKIHLGSGNILMSPNDQYLCIVPKQSSHASDGTLFLPFEGDSLLSVILSKALLLAEDRSITDRTITSQIRQH